MIDSLDGVIKVDGVDKGRWIYSWCARFRQSKYRKWSKYGKDDLDVLVGVDE